MLEYGSGSTHVMPLRLELSMQGTGRGGGDARRPRGGGMGASQVECNMRGAGARWPQVGTLPTFSGILAESFHVGEFLRLRNFPGMPQNILSAVSYAFPQARKP